MSLKQIKEKIKPFLAPLFIVGNLVVSVALGFGTYSRIFPSEQKDPIFTTSSVVTTEILSEKMDLNQAIVASRSGTKYYFPNCSGISRIKLENRVYFLNEEQAKGAGYALARNCKK